jgi:tRNA threonylcarbamoyl adenosine modification protein YeaZ
VAVGTVILLAVESATDTVGVAVVRDDGGSAELTHVGGRAHAEKLAPTIEEVCALTGCRVNDVDAIAVDVGPGLFTGLRVGVATAKALAQALGIGVLGVGSLDILAAAAWERSGGAAGPVVAVVDARRGEVFAAAYRFERLADPSGATDGGPTGGVTGPDGSTPAPGGPPAGRPVDPAAVREGRLEPMAPDGLEAWLVDLWRSHTQVTVVGDGAVRYRERLSVHGPLDLGLAGELAAPPPLAQARLARLRLAAGATPSAPADLVPDYRRAADARINWEQRAPQAGRPGGEGPGPVAAEVIEGR